MLDLEIGTLVSDVGFRFGVRCEIYMLLVSDVGFKLVSDVGIIFGVINVGFRGDLDICVGWVWDFDIGVRCGTAFVSLQNSVMLEVTCHIFSPSLHLFIHKHSLIIVWF